MSDVVPSLVAEPARRSLGRRLRDWAKVTAAHLTIAVVAIAAVIVWAGLLGMTLFQLAFSGWGYEGCWRNCDGTPLPPQSTEAMLVFLGQLLLVNLALAFAVRGVIELVGRGRDAEWNAQRRWRAVVAAATASGLTVLHAAAIAWTHPRNWADWQEAVRGNPGWGYDLASAELGVGAWLFWALAVALVLPAVTLPWLAARRQRHASTVGDGGEHGDE